MLSLKVLPHYLVIVLLCSCFTATAQTAPSSQRQVLQLSGQVLSGDSLKGLEGVAVFVPGTTRGTYTRKSGFFSLPVLSGDTVVFGALGYEKQYVEIPAKMGNSYTVEIRLKEQVNTLPTVDVMPWATEYDLKQAVLRTRLPEELKDRRPHIPPPYTYKSILDVPPMTASQNFRYGQKLLQQGRESRYRAPDVVRIIGVPIR